MPRTEPHTLAFRTRFSLKPIGEPHPNKTKASEAMIKYIRTWRGNSTKHTAVGHSFTFLKWISEYGWVGIVDPTLHEWHLKRRGEDAGTVCVVPSWVLDQGVEVGYSPTQAILQVGKLMKGVMDAVSEESKIIRKDELPVFSISQHDGTPGNDGNLYILTWTVTRLPSQSYFNVLYGGTWTVSNGGVTRAFDRQEQAAWALAKALYKGEL